MTTPLYELFFWTIIKKNSGYIRRPGINLMMTCTLYSRVRRRKRSWGFPFLQEFPRMKQPQELTQRTLLGLQKDQLIDHILDLQRYIRYSTGTTFYANHVHETPYGSIYSQTLTAAHKLLGRLQNIPSHSDRVKSKVNAIHQSVTDHGKGRTSQIALLATNSPKKSRARKPHRPTATNAKSATFHARKRTSYRIKSTHAEKYIYLSKLIHG